VRLRSFALIAVGFAAGAASVALAGYLLVLRPIHNTPKAPLGAAPNYGQIETVGDSPVGRVFKYHAPIPVPTDQVTPVLYDASRTRSREESGPEKAVVLNAKGKAMRRGDRLWLGFDDGTSMLLIDDDYCDSSLQCGFYSLEADEEKPELFIVYAGGWEWFSVFVISKRDGAVVRTEGKPVFSIDRKYAVVSYLNLMDGGGEFSVYSADNGRFRKEASCEVGPLEYYEDAEWTGPETAILSQSMSGLNKDQLPVLQRVNGKWRVMGPVTPTMSGKKDMPLDYECQPSQK